MKISDLKPKVGEWWVCEHISIMGNGDSTSAYKMTPGLIIAGNVKPIEKLYTERDHDRMVEEIAELKGALESLHHIALLGDFGSEVYSGTLLESDVLKLLNQ